jgi:hypothetical protein
LHNNSQRALQTLEEEFEGEEDEEIKQAREYAALLDAGLFTLQQVDLIIANVLVESEQSREKVEAALSAADQSLDSVRSVLHGE